MTTNAVLENQQTQKSMTQQEEDQQNLENEKRKIIDYKMVTFTLAGKDYGIDIMKVKEISKIGNFTYVPNTAPYVKGVYNLRGDIISVIDLRVLFNLEVDQENAYDSKLVNMIILRLEDRILAVIVDSIDKVIGISKESIQPPHPLFGDINIKYINGIVENNERLYILLDVEKIFTGENYTTQVDKIEKASSSDIPKVANAPIAKTPEKESRDPGLGFIHETLGTFKSFTVSDLNSDWVSKRFVEWKKSFTDDDYQLKNTEDAEKFLSTFYSPFTGKLWDDQYYQSFLKTIPKGKSGVFNVWNPGCGSGAESYSIANALKQQLPDAVVKVRGNDSDLIKISTAPGLIIEKSDIPDEMKNSVTEGTKGFQFRKEIKDLVIFEYHDISHDNALPMLDMVIARDLLSFVSKDAQAHFFKVLEEHLKPGGLLILGSNEKISDLKKWDIVDNSPIIAYKKK